MEQTARMTENAQVALEAAAGSMVLLKNLNNTLPFLATEGKSFPSLFLARDR